MAKLITGNMTILTLLCLGLTIPASNALAQQKQHVSFTAAAENSKYTQQQVIDVGDVAGHQVRVYEIHRTFPTNPPVINGLKVTELWTRALSDYTDNSGSGTTYTVYVLENGDKFFTRTALIAQSSGGGKLTATTVGTITGGTGKLAGMRGMVLTIAHADPKAGVNENKTDIDYWIEK